MDPGSLLPPPSWSDEPANLEPAHRANASECAAESLQTLQPREDVPLPSVDEVGNRNRNGQGVIECDDDTSARETNATESQGIVRIQSSSEGHVHQGVGFDATREAQSEGQPLQEASLQSYAEATIAPEATQNQESLKLRPPSLSPRNLTGRRMNLYSFSVQQTPATPPGKALPRSKSACRIGLHKHFMGYSDTVYSISWDIMRYSDTVARIIAISTQRLSSYSFSPHVVMYLIPEHLDVSPFLQTIHADRLGAA